MTRRGTEEQKKLERRIFHYYHKACYPDLDVHEYLGDYAPIDFYLADGDRPVQFVEVKARDKYRHDKFANIYVSFAKWHTLMLASTAFHVQGVFLFWWSVDNHLQTLDVKHVLAEPACYMSITGRFDRSANNDIEPIIMVPRHVIETVGLYIDCEAKGDDT